MLTVSLLVNTLMSGTVENMAAMMKLFSNISETLAYVGDKNAISPSSKLTKFFTDATDV